MEPDKQIEATLAAVYRKHSFESVEQSTPLSALLAKDEESDLYCRGEAQVTVWDAKSEAMAAMLGWIFESGPDPRMAMRRLYALAHEVGPELLRKLTHEEMALLLGDGAGRATSQARSKAIFGGLKAAIGTRVEFGGTHKSARARELMATAAKGNRNRAGKKKPAMMQAA